MGGFSKRDDAFIVSTVTPVPEVAKVSLGLGETNGMMMVSVSATAVKMG